MRRLADAWQGLILGEGSQTIHVCKFMGQLAQFEQRTAWHRLNGWLEGSRKCVRSSVRSTLKTNQELLPVILSEVDRPSHLNVATELTNSLAQEPLGGTITIRGGGKPIANII